MTKPITIEALDLKGFRAYLNPQSFPFRRGKTPVSLAVLAPNAKGKSSLVDAFEFYFSEDATLERLGIRAAERNAGRTALEHVDAKKKNVSPAVEFSFRRGSDKFGDSRAVTAQGTDRTAAATRVLNECVVPFIIRGYELRGFVENQTSEKRYEEIVAWFGLQPLLTIQRNLRALRRQVKQQAESDTERRERLRDLSRITGGTVTAWDEAAICQWFNTQVLAQLDSTLSIAALDEADPGYAALKQRKAAEDESLGLAALRRIQGQIEAIYFAPTEEGGEPAGAIPAFESAIAAYGGALANEAAERAKASQTVFHDVWAAAKKVFDNGELALDACPVCDTPVRDTPHGTREAITVKLDASLGELAAYQAAQAALAAAGQQLSQVHQKLKNGLESLRSSLADTSYVAKAKAITPYQQALAAWSPGEGAPSSAAIVSEMATLRGEVTKAIKSIEDQKGERTFAAALQTADELIGLKDALARIAKIKAQLATLSAQLDAQSLAINKAIVEHTQALIGKLKDDINALYKDIQGDGADAPPIRLDLPGEDETNQQRIQLLIDFSETRKGVVPSGYLSDSQIHTLALSLRLAAMRLFNTGLPVIVLDDIVTSYDADHRKSIAATLAKGFGGHQIIVVTHDERFFALLQEHMPQASWHFRRITELKPDHGPTFHDHRTPDEAIKAKLDKGESAANEIRQAEEEWLLDTCRTFRVKVIIRSIDRPYKYERGELASALASFLKGAGITPPQVPGIANPFLLSLQKGDVENFGSHFSDNPAESASVGDEKARWREFTYFRDQFSCPACSAKRFVRPEPLAKPVCKKCQTPFAFKDPAATSGEGA